ncbi:unnamed protein product [Adineta ricciae]|uniref:Uncharacterized protein n=1 Tax=Adineta ricciae TaxID=249248 RepID=A0A816GWR5_ADIRI|nr:unnamed protein product [Adineta ricciae]
MAHIHVDQNELMRMKKSNLGSLLSTSTSSSTNDSPNAIDTIRKRIETFAKTVDETGRFSFQVRLPTFYIDDSLRVESRFGDVTRSTSATWKNDDNLPTSPSTERLDFSKLEESIIPNNILTENVDESNKSFDNKQYKTSDVQSSHSTEETHEEEKKPSGNTQSNDAEILVTDEKSDLIPTSNPQIIEIPDRADMQESDGDEQPTKPCSLSSSSEKVELDDNNDASRQSSRYALSVENNPELQQQRFYSPTSRNENLNNSTGTTSSSPNRTSPSSLDRALPVALHDPSFRKRSCPINNGSGAFHNHRHQTYSFPRASSPSFPANDNEDAFRSISYVQLKREQDGSLEGIAIQIEQSHQTNGKIQRRRTCMESCGVRRRATILPPRCPSSTRDRSSNDQAGLCYRTNSTPASLN